MFHFFAYISRMKYINRWSLMRNSFSENIQEHSHSVAVIAHALGVIRRDVLGIACDPNACATAALYHDAAEILTGDLPTPIKYYSPAIREAYKQVEEEAARKLLDMLPDQLRGAYKPLLHEEDEEIREYLEQLKARSEMRMLFRMTKDATKEDIEKVVRVFEAFQQQ